MKNSHSWFPTKYEFYKQKLRASRNSKFLSVSSRLMTDITASFYQKYIPLHIKGRLADLGCGNVPFYFVYKQYVTENICIDWPNSFHKNEYLDIACDLNEPLPIADASFDSIIISEVLEHIADPQMLWSEMSRILKQQGKALLSVPFFYKIHEAPHDYFRYTEFSLRNFANKNGFRVVELASFGGLPEIFTDILAKNLVKIPVIGEGCAVAVQGICRLFVRTGVGKKMSARSGVAYPLGYFMVIEKI
jgi:SAM-dependent methyltransferase